MPKTTIVYKIIKMKKEIYENLYTGYADSFNKSGPLPEYPRPQMKRDSFLSLNGEWLFSVSERECEPDNYEESITVPYPPESALSGIQRRIKQNEKLYYKRFFTLPNGFCCGRVLLHFGAVDQICNVKINGKFIGGHEGGYHPFFFDITDALTVGENEISVSVTDELSTDYPYGKQRRDRGGMWYTPISGIWQTVWLESVPEGYIEGIEIVTDTSCAKIKVLSSCEHKRLTLTEIGESFEFSSDSIEITPKTERLWTPESPYLYYFTLETENDKIESYFALREIGIEKIGGIPRLTLNGEPYLFNGLLDQGYFPDGIYTPASYDAYKDDILLTKSLGFNMLRKHIKIEPMIFYHLCDKLGIVVFQDMVNNSDYSFIRDTALPTIGLKRLKDKRLHKNPKSRELFISGMKETIELLRNTPSVLYYTIFNEGWGQFSADENYRLAKSLDPTRIYDATSGWFFQNESDVDSHHVYFKKARLVPNGEKPLVLSEFGGYSYREAGHLFGSANYGYSIYKTRDEYEDAVVTLYEKEITPLVESGISALVYTQLSDIEDETNGFISYDRKFLKIPCETMRKINLNLSERSNSVKSRSITE